VERENTMAGMTQKRAGPSKEQEGEAQGQRVRGGCDFYVTIAYNTVPGLSRSLTFNCALIARKAYLANARANARVRLPHPTTAGVQQRV